MNAFQKTMQLLLPQRVKQAIIQEHQSKSNFNAWIGKVFFGLENNTLNTNENIFSIVSRLANVVSSLPFKMYRKYDQVDNDFTDRLTYYPNSNQSLDEIVKILEVSRNTNGNGYALIFRDIRMRLDKLVPLNPDFVEPIVSEENELWYRVANQGKTYYFHNSDMIHVKHIVGNGNWKGISPIAVLKNSNDFDKAVREFSLKEMQTARDSFLLTYSASISSEKRQAVVDDFKRFYQENGGVLFQEDGVEIKQLARNFIAGDMKIAEDITRDRIANVYNVPSFMLNATSDSFSSNEQLMEVFVNLTLTPILIQYEREFNKKILLKEERIKGNYFKFNLNGLLRGDTSARVALYHGALRDGWMTRDEVRAKEELAPMGGKAADLWVSGDMYPLDMDPVLRKSGGNKTNEEDVSAG
ncbi:phage portal protein [Listeria monocytogenes]|nr:phage portal protein [Listeria monocytogenes]EAE9246322.1 phage portal protein [Listeria monocytogenes]EAG1695654.1 phage portal protein [Listeria monocytogenes]EHD1577632.1 phage portal protein [Listeria monocytogenes]EKZ4845827.1 phage portal protein [Listeria monocytogenes]